MVRAPSPAREARALPELQSLTLATGDCASYNESIAD